MGRPIAAVAALGLLATGLASCAHQETSTAGYGWAFLSDAGDAPRLAYGRPASDDVILMLACQPGADVVRISTLGPADRQIVLASNRTESSFPTDLTSNGPVETSLLEAQGKMSAPALAAFQHTGNLAVLTNGERHRLDATRSDRSQVTAFFRSCRG